MQPLCRYCGRPIAKATRHVWFGASQERHDDFSDTLTATPASREEAQRLCNGRIVSIRWHEGRVYGVTTWDGDSYRDPFFCRSRCAADLGELMAKKGHCTVRYNEATRAQIAAIKARRS